ncbi:hypothetical protein DERF_013894, partial [Dermatophagoides farinae]
MDEIRLWVPCDVILFHQSKNHHHHDKSYDNNNNKNGDDVHSIRYWAWRIYCRRRCHRLDWNLLIFRKY